MNKEDISRVVALWAARPRALLADEPGLGKSAQAIAGADDLLAGTVVWCLSPKRWWKPPWS